LRRVPASHTGRSAKDKFFVRDSHTDGEIWWDNQQAMSHEHFGLLHKDMMAHAAAGKDIFGHRTSLADADADNALPTRVVTELAWHSLFIRNLLIRPDRIDPRRVQAEADHHQPADVSRRPGSPRLLAPRR